jgi:PTH1 family peptidyl-tRNA hydrolase
MKLIVGLGNPGREYKKSRHNFGFTAADFSAKALGAGKWRLEKKFQAEVAELDINDEKVLFVKPQTFYNLVGQSVRAIQDYYKLTNADMLVIHDEMDLPVGTVRTRKKGTAAGNNGVQNLIDHLGEDFARVRVGSGVAASANGLTKPASNHRDHVLSRPTKNEAETIAQLMPHIQHIVTNFIAGTFDETTYSAA